MFCSDAEGNELAFAAKCAELFESPLVRFGSALGQQIFGETLARVRRGFCREAAAPRRRLRRARSLARILAILDGKQRLAGGAIEQIDETLLGGLRDGVDSFAVMRRR